MGSVDWEDRLDDWELELELGARLDGSDWVTLEKFRLIRGPAKAFCLGTRCCQSR